jgi:hypothetical protein
MRSSIEETWKERLDALNREVKALGLQPADYEEKLVVRLRWAILKDKYEQSQRGMTSKSHQVTP